MAGVKGRSGRQAGIKNGLSTAQRIELRAIRLDSGFEKNGVFCLILPGNPGIYPTLDRARAHRVVYELYYGEIPKGFNETIDHLCCNKRCIEITHLEHVIRAVNIQRAFENGLHKQSECPDCGFTSTKSWVSQHINSGCDTSNPVVNRPRKPRKPRDQESPRLDAATTWLNDLLKSLPEQRIKCSEAHTLAVEAGFTKRTIRRVAKDVLGLTTYCKPGGGTNNWWWKLPEEI